MRASGGGWGNAGHTLTGAEPHVPEQNIGQLDGGAACAHGERDGRCGGRVRGEHGEPSPVVRGGGGVRRRAVGQRHCDRGVRRGPAEDLRRPVRLQYHVRGEELVQHQGSVGGEELVQHQGAVGGGGEANYQGEANH